MTLNYRTENLHRYGEIILHCNVNITYNIRAAGNSIVLKYVCALLNSGGGILHMRNQDAEVFLLIYLYYFYSKDLLLVITLLK